MLLPVLLVVVVVVVEAVVDPADVALEPVVAGGMKGNPSPPLKHKDETIFQIHIADVLLHDTL